MHYDQHLPLCKILAIVQAASKRYNVTTNVYRSKVLRYHPTRADKVVCVPRLAPPESKLIPVMRKLEAEVGVQSSEDGTLALTSFNDAICDILEKDTGKHGMPLLESYLSGEK
eukprot:5364686-Prymnesium_polylepis.1